jgi:hypothetical protein
MHAKSLAKIALAVVMVAAAASPTFAKMKEPNACATQDKRCTAVATCGKDGWCKVYGCIGEKTVLLPFACNDKAGGCLQKHCS